MEITAQPIAQSQEKLSAARLKHSFLLLGPKSIDILNRVKTLGFTNAMEEYEQRKLGIFNQLNFFQLIFRAHNIQ